MSGSIHFVNGEISGVGSSLFCRSLIEYLKKSTDLDLTIIDLEPICVIGKTYAPQYYSQTSEALISEKSIFDDDLELEIPTIKLSSGAVGIEQGDLIYELAYQGKTVIVNLPSRSYESVHNWLQLADIVELSKQTKVQIWQWFTTNGSADSMDILTKLYQIYANSFNYVIIKNEGDYPRIQNSWFSWKNNIELQAYIETFPTYQLMMPSLSLPDYRWDILSKNCLSFTTAKSHGHSAVTILEKQKIHTWLNTMFNQLSSIPFNQFEDLSGFEAFDDDELFADDTDDDFDENELAFLF